MAKTVFVSSAQKAAARAMVNRSAVTGRSISNSVRKIADAKIDLSRSKPSNDSVSSHRTSA